MGRIHISHGVHSADDGLPGRGGDAAITEALPISNDDSIAMLEVSTDAANIVKDQAAEQKAGAAEKKAAASAEKAEADAKKAEADAKKAKDEDEAKEKKAE